MKRQNTTLTTTNPQDALVTALAQAIVNAKAADGTNPIMEALAQATGYQVAPAVPATPKPHKKHNCYANTFKLTSDGRPKPTAADPLRNTDDIHAIGNYLLTHGNVRNRQRNYTLYICGITLGLRVGDIVKLKVGDVYDVTTGTVRKHANVVNEKTLKNTTDLITPHAAQAIDDLVNVIRAQQSGVLDPEWPLFQTQKWVRAGGMTNHLTKTQVYRMLTEAAKACGVHGNISTHTMRKTYGYMANKALIESGLPTNQVMEIMQAKYHHDSQTTTMHYLGLQQDQIDAAALCVDAAIS